MSGDEFYDDETTSGPIYEPRDDPEWQLNDPVWAESPEGQAYLEEHRKAERKRREWERRTAGRIR